MKLLFHCTIAAAVITLLLFAAQGVQASSCVAGASGNWSAAGTWTTCGGGVPTSSDTVEIKGGATVTVDVSNAVAASIQVGGNPGAGAGTLVFNAGSQVTVPGSVTLGSSIAAGNNGTINMTTGGILTAGSLALGTLSTKTWTPGTGTVELTAVNTLPTTIFTSFNNLTITSGTTTLGASIPINGTLTQTANIAVGAFTLTVSGTGTHNAGTSTVSGAGGYTLASGATFLTSSATGVDGNITTTTKTLNVAANFIFNGNVAQVTGAVMPATVNNCTINNAAGVTLNKTTTISGNLNVTTGTFTIGAFTITVNGSTTVNGTISITNTTGTKTFTGNVTVNNGGTWIETVGEAVTFGGNLQNDGTLTASTGIHTFSGAAKTISGINIVALPSVTVTGTVTNNTTLTVATTLAGAGTLTNGVNATVNTGATTVTPTLNATATGNTVNYNRAGTQTVKATTYNHLTISGSSTKTLAGTIGIAGNLTISGGTFSLSTFTADRTTAGGTLTVASGAALQIAGTGTIPANYSTHSFGATSTVTYSGTTQSVVVLNSGQSYGNLTVSGSATKTLAGSIGVAGNITVSASTLDLSTFTANRTSAGGTLTVSNLAFLKIGGTNSLPANFSAHSIGSTSTIEYSGTNQSVAILNSSQKYGHLTISGSQTKTIAGSISVNSNLNLTAGSLSIGANTLTINGAIVTTSGTLAGGTTSNVSIAGAVASTALPAVTLNNLTISRANGISLGGNVTIGGILTFTSGNITTGANNLYISSTGSVSRTSGHVIGNFRKYIATGATSKTFEIGDATNYTPVTVAFASVTTAGDLTASVAAGDHANIGSSTLVVAKTVNRNWTLTNNSVAFTTYSATFTFVAGDLDAGVVTSNLIVGKYNAGWTYPVVGIKTATTTQTTGISTFGDFQIGEPDAKVWDGGAGTSNWGDALNWNNDTLPVASNNVDLSAANTININVAAVANNILLNNAGLTLTINAGSSLNVSGNLTLTAGTLNTAAAFPTVVGTVNVAGGTVGFTGTSSQTVPGYSYNNLTISGSSTKTLGGTIGVAGDLTINGGTLDLTTFTANRGVAGGTLTVSNGAALKIGGTGTLPSNYTTHSIGATSTIEYSGSTQNVSSLNSSQNYGNLTISGSATKSLIGAVAVNSTLLLSAGDLSIGANTLTLNGTISTASGTLTGGSSSNILIGGAGASLALPAITLNDLTINRASGVTAGNTTVNGVLNLQTANPSTTQGTLDLGINTLNMGSSATTVGVGDVTGIVRRTSMSPNIEYTFGNQFTSVTFENGGTIPSELSFKINIGAAPSWKTNGIKRLYDIAYQNGIAFNCTQRFHYLDSELNGNNVEDDLVIYRYQISGSSLIESGRSNLDGTSNWVELANITGNGTVSFGTLQWTLATKTTISKKWNGTTSTDWTSPLNWTGGLPGPTDDVVIPDGATTNFDPTLPASTTIQSLTINTGGILNGATGVLTLSGANGAWLNNGVFNYGTSNVTFTSPSATMAGQTDLYNVTINTGAGLTILANQVMQIFGAITNNGMWTADFVGSTVKYAGGNQTVITPNGSLGAYHHLTLGGTGTKTMPGAATSIHGNFSLENSISVTAAAPLTIGGNVSLQSGTTFNSGAFNHSLMGNWINSGTFVPGTNTITFAGTSAQTIAGTTQTNFNNLTISNTSSIVSSNVNSSIAGNLSITSGTLDLGTFTANRASGGGVLTVSNGASLKIGGANTLPANFSAHSIGTTSTIEYSGSNQTIAVLASADYGNLKVSGSGTKTLAGNVNISGTLTLAGATITTGASTLYLKSTGTVSRTSGHVIGNFKKYVATGAASTTFEIGDASNYTPVTLAFANVTSAGDLTARVAPGDHANIASSTLNAAKSVNRNWTLTNSGVAFTTYDATFNFVPGDVDGGANTDALVAGRYSGGWTYPAVGIRTSTTTQATGVTSFGDFQLAEAVPLPPNVPLVNSVLPSGTQSPGTDLVYTIVFTNDGGQAAQAFTVIEPIPANADFKLGSPNTDLATTGMTVVIEYSNDNATTWTYTPVDGAGGALAGYDRTVTHVRWSFTGNLSQISPNNTGTISLTVQIR